MNRKESASHRFSWLKWWADEDEKPGLQDGEKSDKNAGIVFLEREGTKLKVGDRIARITYSFDNKNFAAAYKKMCESVIVHPQKPKREKLLVKVFV